MERVDAFLQRLGWQPNMTAVQKAYEIDDWCQVLIDIPFRHVERAMLDYLSTSENLTEHDTIRRIAPATIRREAWLLKESEEMRSRPQLAAPAKTVEQPMCDEERRLLVDRFQAFKENFAKAADLSTDDYMRLINARAREITAARHAAQEQSPE